MPLSTRLSADSWTSWTAASRNAVSTLRVDPIATCASASVRDRPIRASARVSRRRARESCNVLARKIVHVTSDAKARLTITALTRMSADMNIDHGDSSSGCRAEVVAGLAGASGLSA